MLQRYFNFLAHGTTLRTEIVAGVSSFLATLYIIVVNPAILSQAGLPFSGVLTATVLLSFFCSLMMGLYAKNPILVAPGMGLNAFFTFAVVKGMNVPWPTALGAVFWAGIVFLLLSVFNVRTAIVAAIPKPLRYAISSGIGLFIVLIGFVNAKFVVANPATLVGLNALHDPATLTFLLGLVIMAALLVRQFKAAVVVGIAVTTLAAWPIGRWWGGSVPLVQWQGVWAAPDFSLLFQLDLINSLQWSLWPVIFAFTFTDLFDSLSTFVGVAEAAQLHDADGNPRNVRQSLLTDAVATALGGLLGSSPGTAYIESAVGVSQGGRTGWVAVVAAFLFLPFLFLSPLLSVIPSIATAPALVLVGAFMMQPVAKINWHQPEEAIPCLLALVLIPFSYSITQGIIFGFLSWTLLQVIAGKGRQIAPALWVIDAFALLSLAIGH